MIHLVTENTDWWKYITDWQTTDWIKYNPFGGPETMNYAQYKNGRDNGTIPAPDPQLVRNNILNPLITEQDGI